MKNFQEKSTDSMTPKKERYFAVNHMFTFAMRYIGLDHSAATKLIHKSYEPKNSQRWKNQLKTFI